MAGMVLTKHEKETFVSQTIMLSGHGYIDCAFTSCTLLVTNTPLLLRGCSFTNCNWRLEYDILWGDPKTRSTLLQLLRLIEGIDSSDENIQEFSSELH